MNEESSQSIKSVLLLGHTSSLANEIIAFARQEGYEIEATRRGPVTSRDELTTLKYHELDLEDEESVKKFLSKIRQNRYERVICLIGKTYNSFSGSKELKDVQRYFNIYCSRLFYLIAQICENNLLEKEISQVTVLSSRAYKYASFDPYYSAVKGATTSFVRSLSAKLGMNRNLVSLSPGLIIGSKMEGEMTKNSLESHLRRSDYLLLSVKEASNEIWKKSLIRKSSSENQTDYVIGPEYI